MPILTTDENEKIFKIINYLDPDPESARPVSFWFYSDREERIYRLAAHFQSNGYRIRHCGQSILGRFLCIAEKTMIPEIELLSRLCIDMQIVAERWDVEFDGWETPIQI